MQPGPLTELLKLYEQEFVTISNWEWDYINCGITFYILTIIDDRSQGHNVEVFRESFWADSENFFIPRLRRLRQLREQAKAFLRATNVSEAERCLKEMIDVRGELDAKIEKDAMPRRLAGLAAHLRDREGWTKNTLLQQSTEEDKRTIRNHPRFREWALQLPEIESGLKLGILENEEQALRSLLEVEDRWEGK
ncbi:uncharacterized protein RCC_00997 [Ramularia collo-cygni]|uniref:Uncharacterized protein n=1 Tax=Ramularia collo-cygni TaxID=112498 RepID=A0A2D3UNM5_9PEZI|nr:uncharacterized protein RCC_00997 [Ramularia collo-cygni]CZT15098.1 uncharacterized protein RCC_00997 [Ramularia collo-cygni]